MVLGYYVDNKTIHSPLALREGFHVVAARALAERLARTRLGSESGTNLRLYFGSIRFSEDIDLGCAAGRRGRHATRHSADAG